MRVSVSKFGANLAGAGLAVPRAGPVTCLRVFNGALWVGGQTGISCFDLGSLQARGTIASQQQVTGAGGVAEG